MQMALQAKFDAPESSVVDRRDPRWVRLRNIVAEKSLITGNFILSSGRTSKYLFQLRQTTMFPESASLIGAMIVEFLRREGLRTVGGMELGAVPLVAAAAVESHHAEYPVKAFFVRKTAKKHGAKERIDGHIADGDDILLVDDVATTGKSIFETVAGVREEYPACRMTKALVVVDREEGAAQALAAQGIALFSILKKSDFAIPGSAL
jgi:orotate phosphoribosyltransferase